ncbi:uncharacterized protein LOC144807793 [Lissotriton helveticus]
MYFMDCWRETVSDQWVLQVVSEGVRLGFAQTTPDCFKSTPCPRDALKWVALLEGIESLVVKNAVIPVPEDQLGLGVYSIIFLVSKRTGDLRPVMDLKWVNTFVPYQKFKMVSLQVILPLISQGDFLASTDLRDAYLHVPVHPDSQKFLRFCVLGRHYQFQVLPFGLCSSPRVFTKVLAPLVGHLHGEGISVFPYLDEILISASSLSRAELHVRRVCHVLEHHGFLVNVPKSSLVPAQELTYIGALFRTQLGMVFLPPARILSLMSAVRSLLLGPSHPVSLWLRVQGLMSASLLTVPWARLHMYPVVSHILLHWDPCSLDMSVLIPVSSAVRVVLDWWLDEAHLSRGRPFLIVSSQVLTTDASLLGWGTTLGDSTTQGVWPRSVLSCSSNYKELKAVLLDLLAFSDLLQGHHVQVRTDNQVVMSYVNHQGGCRVRSLSCLSHRICSWAEVNLASPLRFTCLVRRTLWRIV